MEQPFKSKEENRMGVFLSMLRSFPASVGSSVAGKIDDLAVSRHLHAAKRPLDWDGTAAGLVRSRIDEMLNSGVNLCLSKHEASLQIGDFEQKLMDDIQQAVQSKGSSNLTRTQAYLDIYREYPELHWALLAHFVSRNAGWNMSDLAGDANNGTQSSSEIELAYRFLERSNALIFQDAYPQLLLYAYSRKYGKSLFHLLPKFHISRFMMPFWEHFWLSRSSSLLAVGLIINEQCLMEQKVIRHPFYKKAVTGKAYFRMNTLCGLHQILLPYSLPSSGEAGQSKLAGKALYDFASLSARISSYKQLYAILFGIAEVREGAAQFAFSVPHTGSRADYWPSLFTVQNKEALTSQGRDAELLNNEYSAASKRIYSPKLHGHVTATPYESLSREDWLLQLNPLDSITEPKVPMLCAIQQGHRLDTLKRSYAHQDKSSLKAPKTTEIQQR